MIIDTSAIMAMLLDEPEALLMMEAMASAPVRLMSAGTWMELGTVVVRRQNAQLAARSEAMVPRLRLEIAPLTVAQSDIGRAAYRTYGRGTGHPAALNFGDCFAYALAKETGEPLLFKGDDFSQTDITPALR